MRVTHDKQVLVVGWQYDDPQHPEITDCILRGEDKKEIKRVTVKRHKNDPPSKDKARKFSLNKLLYEMYDGRENRGVRKLFWDAYIHRNDKKETA